MCVCVHTHFKYAIKGIFYLQRIVFAIWYKAPFRKIVDFSQRLLYFSFLLYYFNQQWIYIFVSLIWGPTEQEEGKHKGTHLTYWSICYLF